MKTGKLLASVILAAALSLTASAGEKVTDSLGFASQSANSVAQLLKGKVSGVRVSSVDGNINGLMNVNIRGINNLRGDSQPLWIVDGVIMNTDINRNLDGFRDLSDAGYCSPLNPLALISPYDIESIEVLKNTSATAVYGAMGANGVILINTRHDKNDGLSIKWNSNMSVNVPASRGEGIKPSVGHNHYLSLSGNFTKTLYYLSAQYRNAKGVVSGNRSDFFSLTSGIDAIANDFMQFGMRSIISIGKAYSVSGTANYGYSSMMTAIRGVSDDESVEAWQKDFDDEAQDNRITGSIYFNVKFAPGLIWKNTLGIDFQNLNRFFWYGKTTSFGSLFDGAASVLGNSIFRDNFKTSLEYGRFFGKHRIDFSVKGEQFFVIRKYNAMEGSTYFSEILRNKGLSISGAYGNPQIYELPLNQLGAGACAAYDYDGLVGVKGSLTATFTSQYLDRPELFPSAELYFNAGKLFLEKSAAFSSLRLDAGYGLSGRTDYTIAEPSALVPTEAAHYFKNLYQLTSKELHATLSAGLFGERLKFSLTYYNKRSTDRNSLLSFGEKTSPALDALWDDAPKSVVKVYESEIGNRGFEIDANARIIEGGNFKWNASANFAYNANRMNKVAVEDIYGLNNANVPGYPAGSIYGFDENSGIDRLLGSPTPKYLAGLSTDLRYKNLYLDILFDGAFGHSILNLNDMLLEGQDRPSSSYVENASYFRLSRLSAGYAVPLKWRFVKSLDIKFSAGNLVTFTKYSGWNPDVNSYGNSPMSAGADYGSYPLVRTFVLGIAVKF